MYANSGAGATEFYSRAASVSDGIITLTASAPYFAKIATGQKLNDFAGTLNGAAVVTDNSVAMPTGINRLDFGLDHVSNRMNGHIASLRYYPTRLTNAKLQELST
jgi:hypothetical protein